MAESKIILALREFKKDYEWDLNLYNKAVTPAPVLELVPSQADDSIERFLALAGGA